MSDPPPGWVERVRELRYTFGEFRLWTVRFSVWTPQAHLLERGDVLAALPPITEAPGHVQALAIQSVPVAADLPKVSVLPDAIRYVPAHFPHHSIAIEGTFDDYLGRLSGKSRHEMARKARRFLAHAVGRHELREYRAPAEMADFVRTAAELSKATYHGRLLDVALPDDPGFVRDLEAAAASDDVRGYLILLDGRAAAFGYCRATGDVLAFEHTGYDPALAAHSPGIYLLQEILRRVHAEGRFRVFDFGTGDAQYKRSYATLTRRCATVLQFRRTLGNRLIVASHRGLTAFSDACVRLLDRLGLKARVRRLFRSGGRRKEAEGARGEV